MSQVQEAAAVIHEMAHAVLHNPEELKKKKKKREYKRKLLGLYCNLEQNQGSAGTDSIHKNDP